MRRRPRKLLLAALAATAAAVCAAGPDGTVKTSPPGVYGRVLVMPHDKPEVTAPQPVTVEGKAGENGHKPIHMWVPLGHRTGWPEYCGRYGACSAPVWFVRDDWYHHFGAGRGMPHGHDHD